MWQFSYYLNSISTNICIISCQYSEVFAWKCNKCWQWSWCCSNVFCFICPNKITTCISYCKVIERDCFLSLTDSICLGSYWSWSGNSLCSSSYYNAPCFSDSTSHKKVRVPTTISGKWEPKRRSRYRNSLRSKCEWINRPCN